MTTERWAVRRKGMKFRGGKHRSQTVRVRALSAAPRHESGVSGSSMLPRTSAIDWPQCPRDSPSERRQLVRVRCSFLDGLERRRGPPFPDRPLLLRGVRDLGEKRERKLLDLRPDPFVREQAGNFPHVAISAVVTEISQHLSDLGAPEQMLLRLPEERDQ